MLKTLLGRAELSMSLQFPTSLQFIAALYVFPIERDDRRRRHSFRLCPSFRNHPRQTPPCIPALYALKLTFHLTSKVETDSKIFKYHKMSGGRGVMQTRVY